MKWILRALHNEDILVRSPEATRTPCFAPDVVEAWKLLVEKGLKDLDLVNKLTLHFVDSYEYAMIQIANKVKETLVSHSKIILSEYELGEFVNGKPARQHEVNKLSKEILGWEAKTSLEDGIRKTAEWLKESEWF
jgi:nucleoside-diphosphate-sugar epimerase